MERMMHKLGTIVKFEIVRTLKKPSFWVAAILLPVILVGYIALSGFIGYNATKAVEEGSDVSGLSLSLLDEAGVVNAELAEAAGISIVEDKEAAVAEVRNEVGKIFYYIPADFAENPKVQIYAQTESESLLDNYTAPMTQVLQASALEKVTAAEVVVLSSAYSFETTTFKDGQENNILGRMIVPMMALGLFYLLIVMFGNRQLTSTLEEKENRVSEMILTATTAKALIVGKIISLIALGFIQVVVLVVPVVIAYAASNNLSVGGVNVGAILPQVVFEPTTIAISLLLMLAGYVLFTGMNVMIGALVPSVREANNYVGVAMILVISPVFFISSFLSATPDTMTYVLSYFPFSAPVALLARNAFGTLPAGEALGGLAVIAAAATVIIALAIRVFRTGTMEYSSRVSLRRVLGRGK
jgi:ABC-2 type transport system permease protein